MRTSYCPDLYHLAPCIDGRTRLARRFRLLVASFADEVGGGLTAIQIAMIRQAAALTVQAEQMQDAIISGASIDSDDVIRVSSEARRMLSALRLAQRGEALPSLALDDYLRQKSEAS